VLCAAYCTQVEPLVWWYETENASAARVLESTLKGRYGEPPWPRELYAGCVNGTRLRDALITAVGEGSWQAGFAEAVFLIGEKLSLLFRSEFDAVWAEVGIPPGPWGVDA
jgi:hypothetical protein